MSTFKTLPRLIVSHWREFNSMEGRLTFPLSAAAVCRLLLSLHMENLEVKLLKEVDEHTHALPQYANVLPGRSSRNPRIENESIYSTTIRASIPHVLQVQRY